MWTRRLAYGSVAVLGVLALHVSSTSSTVLVGQVPERFASIGESPDAPTLGAVKAAAVLLRILQKQPTANDPSLAGVGDVILTSAEAAGGRETGRPQIALHRYPQETEDGEYTGFENEIRLEASAPTGQGSAFCTASLGLRYTQLSPAADGKLTASNVLTALDAGPAGSISMDSFSSSLNATLSSSDSGGFDTFGSRGLLFYDREMQYWKYGSGGSPGPASAVYQREALVLLQRAVACINKAFTRQADPSVPSRAKVDSVCAKCVVTGSVPFPNHADRRLITSLGGDIGEPSATIAVVDQNEEVLWRYDTNQWTELEPLSESDPTGHLFLRYNPGRYDGVVVVGIDGGEVQTYDTLPESGSYYGRFYNAKVADVDGDGTLDVEVTKNDCEPACATGAQSKVAYKWDGATYGLN